jgi:hypothetical protein
MRCNINSDSLPLREAGADPNIRISEQFARSGELKRLSSVNTALVLVRVALAQNLV